MSTVNPAGPSGAAAVLELRQRILERSQAMAASMPANAVTAPAAAQDPAGFGTAMRQAIDQVNALQSQGAAASAAYERGEAQDIAAVMLARQKASIAFEATLQARNRLLSAYRDIMNMPV